MTSDLWIVLGAGALLFFVSRFDWWKVVGAGICGAALAAWWVS